VSRVALSEADHRAVSAAVAAAEAGTRGEIVPVLAPASDAYHDVALHWAIAAMLAVAGAAAAWPGVPVALAGGGWNGEVPVGRVLLLVMLAQAAAFVAARLLLAWRPLRLALAPRATKRRRVRRRADAAFRLGAQGRTRGRVGVLVYLSADERMAEVVADAAVAARVPAERWGAVMAALVDRVRAGDAAGGLAAAVAAVGAILAEGFPIEEGDVNELPDRVVEL
jgi:putative membrane protein